MDKNYPRYPVDFYRLRVLFNPVERGETQFPALIADIVRENPFGTAFAESKEREQTSENFS